MLKSLFIGNVAIAINSPPIKPIIAKAYAIA